MPRCHRAIALIVGSLLIISGCFADYRVAVADGVVTVDRAFWKPMPNPEAFADNFEARETRRGEEYGQVITVFKSAMRADQTGGIEVSSSTWVEFMVVHPPAITFQVRVSHAGHWVMSRQTMSRLSALNAGSQPNASLLSPEDLRALLVEYSDEIARTRSILEALVAR